MTDLLDLTDDQMRELLADRVVKLTEKLEKSKLALAAYTTNGAEPEQKKPSTNGESNDSKIGGTFIVQQEKYVKLKDELIGSRDLYIAHQQRNPNYKSSFGTFSGQLSHRVQKGNTNLKQYVIMDVPMKYKYWYGLKSWFVGKEPKEAYRAKIYAKIEEG